MCQAGGPRGDARLCLAGEFVAQFKFTVLLMPNGPMRITSGPFEPDLYKSEFEVQDGELKVGSRHSPTDVARCGGPAASVAPG